MLHYAGIMLYAFNCPKLCQHNRRKPSHISDHQLYHTFSYLLIFYNANAEGLYRSYGPIAYLNFFLLK